MRTLIKMGGRLVTAARLVQHSNLTKIIALATEVPFIMDDIGRSSRISLCFPFLLFELPWSVYGPLAQRRVFDSVLFSVWPCPIYSEVFTSTSNPSSYPLWVVWGSEVVRHDVGEILIDTSCFAFTVTQGFRSQTQVIVRSST